MGVLNSCQYSDAFPIQVPEPLLVHLGDFSSARGLRSAHIFDITEMPGVWPGIECPSHNLQLVKVGSQWGNVK